MTRSPLDDAIKAAEQAQKQFQAQVDLAQRLTLRLPEMPQWLDRTQLVMPPAVADWLRQSEEVAKQVRASIRAFEELFSPTAKFLLGSLPKIALTVRRAVTLRKAGVVPHRTIPFALIDKYETDIVGLGREIEAYYLAHWPSVRQELEAKLSEWKVDNIAQSTFSEALDNLEASRFRSVVALCMLEIERSIRHEFNARSRAHIFLKDLVGGMELSDIEPRGWYAVEIGNIFLEHIYAPVRSDDQISVFLRDNIPNRHAALHGIIVYGKYLNALNALFLLYSTFNFIHVAKQRAVPPTALD